MKLKPLFISMSLLFFILGCSNDVKLVKKGVLDIDTTLTVGDAFDNYTYFDKTKWSSFKDPQNRQIVEFRGRIKSNSVIGLKDIFGTELTEENLRTFQEAKNNENFTLVAQFRIDKKSETFTLSYCDILLDNGEELFKSDPSVLVKNIYANAPQVIIAYRINITVKDIIAEKRRAEWEADRPNRERREAEKRAEEERIAAERRAEYEREEAERYDRAERIQAERIAEREKFLAEKKAEEERIAAERRAEKEKQISQHDMTITQGSNDPIVQQPQDTSYAISPSFDCTKASTPAEKLICSNKELAEADIHLFQVYKKALNIAADKALLKKNQNEWLKNERNRCSDVPCMLQSYNNRINQLSSN